jgi:hypothetical protein
VRAVSCETFVAKNFRSSTKAEIEGAQAIIAEYQVKGFVLTLLQLFYQFVSRALIANEQSEYKRLGAIVRDARRAGLIDWAAIEDSTRGLEAWRAYLDPQAALREVAEGYAQDPWRGQRWRVEVWIEKEALVGVIEPVCERRRLPYFAARGNGSDSELYRAGKRFASQLRAGQAPLVLYLGDHDPTGIDATRDVRERLKMFARAEIEVRRVALNIDQVEAYRPPPNTAKETDSRYVAYVSEFGPECWELDALDPETIDALIEAEIAGVVDQAGWNSAMARERASADLIGQVAERWSDIREFLRASGGGAA